MRALATTPDDARRLLAEIDRATRVGDFRTYRQVPDYARRVHLAADVVEQLVDGGSPDLAIDLAERALRKLERALERADDSDGLIGDLLRRFQDVHLAACEAARPDAVDLAERLARWELDGEWDVFRGAAERYVDVLGETGLAAYRAAVENRWDEVPALAPRQEDRAFERSDRFNVRYAMEALARSSGDVDALVAVHARDQSSAYRFLTIAEVCRDAGRADEALMWAERGVRAFPVGTDVRLRELLADLYLDRGRSDDAMALIWAELVEHPSLTAYQRLRRYADRISEGPAWKARAIEEVRRSTELAIAAEDARPRPMSRGPRRWDPLPDGSVLVEILAWERDLDMAWAEARRLGCSRSGWLRLARLTEASHPEDAAAVYRTEVEALLAVTDKRVYEEAVDLLRRLKPLLEGLGKDDEFVSFAHEIRAANVRRPAFIATFDRAHLLGSG
jgi:uncharacterized Zn finger protein